MAKSMNAILVVLAAVLLVPAASYAAGLGTITVRSALGQPLDAEIEVVAAQPGDELQVRLASREAYREAGVDLSPALQGARFAIEKRGDKTIIRVRTSQPVNDPFFSVLVELQGRTGRLSRQYTVLVDPADYRTASTPAAQQAAAAPAPAAATPARVQAQSPKASAAKTPTPVAVAPTIPAPVVATPPAPAPVVAAPAPVIATPIEPAAPAPSSVAAAPAPQVQPPVATAPAPAPVAATPRPVEQVAPAAPAVAAAPPVTASPTPAARVESQPAPAATTAAPVQPAPQAIAASTPRAAVAPEAAAPAQQRAEASGTYQIRRGDTLGAIARKWMPEGVTHEQMLVGLYHTNRSVFIRDNINLIRAGATLFIPGREDVLVISSSDAASQVRTHMAAFTKYRHATANAGSGSARISQAQREAISRRVGVKRSTRAM